MPVRNPIERRAYTVTEAACILGLSEANVRELMKQGRLKLLRCGGAVRIPDVEIDRLLSDNLDHYYRGAAE